MYVCAVREPPAVYHTLHTKVHTPYALTQGASAHAARAARAAEALSGLFQARVAGRRLVSGRPTVRSFASTRQPLSRASSNGSLCSQCL